MGPLETDEEDLKRVEVYNVGIIIYYLESNFAYGSYQNYGEESDVPDWVEGLGPSAELAEDMVNSETQEPEFLISDTLTTALNTEIAYRDLEETTSSTYTNQALKDNLGFVRLACGKFFETNPVVTVDQDVGYENSMGQTGTSDANEYLLEVYNDFFAFVDTMTNQNDSSGDPRPTYDEGISKITEFLAEFESIIEQIPSTNLIWGEERLLI